MSIFTQLNRETSAEVLKVLRAPEFIIPTTLFPVLFYSVFGVLVGGSGQQAIYLLATFGVFAVMGPALFSFGVGVSIERERGWLDLKRVAPMPVWIYLLAKLLTAIIASSLTLMLLYAVGGFAGGVTLTKVQWLTLYLTQLVIGIPFSFLGLGLGFMLNGKGAVAITNIVYLGLSVIGGLFMPTFMFPKWFQMIGTYLPTFHAGQIALSIVGLTENPPIDHWSALALFGIGFALSAGFAWQMQRK